MTTCSEILGGSVHSFLSAAFSLDCSTCASADNEVQLDGLDEKFTGGTDILGMQSRCYFRVTRACLDCVVQLMLEGGWTLRRQKLVFQGLLKFRRDLYYLEGTATAYRPENARLCRFEPSSGRYGVDRRAGWTAPSIANVSS